MGALELPEHTALIATGSLGSETMTSRSDLDLVLLHPPGTSIPETLWYPLWDAKVRLDAAVRTPEECVKMVGSEVTAALALLQMRPLRGDAALSQEVRDLVLRAWRVEVKRSYERIVDTAIARWRRSGSLVTMTRPDLKHGRGGLRDIELIEALALGNVCNPPKLHEERALLLDIRTLLHEQARRPRDVLDPEFAVDIAADLGFADRYELSRRLAHVGRTVDDAVTEALRTARDLLPRRFVRRQPRKPLDVDVVESDGQVSLARNPDLTDPGLPLRVATASARTALPIADAVWPRLRNVPAPPRPWPRGMAEDFLELLSSPNAPLEIISWLDQHGHWASLVSGWEFIRGRMPREPIHVHTIDRHSLVVTQLCADQSVEVARPDLLGLAALFHDMGKGREAPHEEVGAEMVREMATTLGLDRRDTAVVSTLVEQHTRIPAIVSTRDVSDPSTVEEVLDALHYDLLTLSLMEVLVEADSVGTGPGVWNTRMRAGLRAVCQQARATLRDVAPVPPTVTHDAALEITELDETASEATICWSGADLDALVKLLAVFAAKSWNVEAADVVCDSKVRGRFVVRNPLGAQFHQADLQQAHNSGVFATLPSIQGAVVATYWNGTTLEVRTQDRLAALGALLGVVPSPRWVRMRRRGASMIVACELAPGFNTAEVEREVTRVLANG